jgi:hypothetical protein
VGIHQTPTPCRHAAGDPIQNRSTSTTLLDQRTEVVINTVCVRPLGGVALVALIIAWKKKVSHMVDIVQGQALRDLEIGEEFYNANNHTTIITLSVYEGTLSKVHTRYLHVTYLDPGCIRC